MAKHSISEAARLTKKARSTLHNHIKNGRLSAEKDEDGNPVVDTSELERVYGSLQAATVSEHVQTRQAATAELDRENTRLKSELAAARSMLEEIRTDRDRWAKQAERMSLLLEDKRAVEMPIPATHKPPERDGVLRAAVRFLWK